MYQVLVRYERQRNEAPMADYRENVAGACAPDRAAESAHELKKSRPLNERIHTSQCCTNCCTHTQNAQKRPGIPRNGLYFTTTYTKLSHFVIGKTATAKMQNQSKEKLGANPVSRGSICGSIFLARVEKYAPEHS